MSKITEKNAYKVSDIYADTSLTIPDYQRPYKWSEYHVNQLLTDLVEHYEKKQEYRLGTIVLHNNEKNNVVDGKQRLITLSLLLSVLDDKIVNRFLEQKFNHSLSHYNIQRNYQIIKRFVSEHKLGTDFAGYIKDKCQFICIVLNDIDEAFQFFDSQNSRGKALEPYDLLKAYHLRAIESDNPELKQYVENWEHAVENNPTLDLIISQMLFRLRRWQRAQNAEIFNNKDIVVFKGISLNNHSHYPYLNQQIAANAIKQFSQYLPFILKDEYCTEMFQVCQSMINGEFFFKYVEHYRSLYQELFGEKGKLQNIPIQDEFQGESVLSFLKNYSGSSRTGDKYIFMLFQSTVMAYYDKFGDANLELVVHRIVKWAYRLRLINKRVSFPTIENAATEHDGLLTCIEYAIEPKDVIAFMPKLVVRKKIVFKTILDDAKELVDYLSPEAQEKEQKK